MRWRVQLSSSFEFSSHETTYQRPSEWELRILLSNSTARYLMRVTSDSPIRSVSTRGCLFFTGCFLILHRDLPCFPKREIVTIAPQQGVLAFL